MGRGTMTNKLAIVLGCVVVAAIVADQVLGLGWGLYLARRFVDLLGWVAFWR